MKMIKKIAVFMLVITALLTAGCGWKKAAVDDTVDNINRGIGDVPGSVSGQGMGSDGTVGSGTAESADSIGADSLDTLDKELDISDLDSIDKDLEDISW